MLSLISHKQKSYFLGGVGENKRGKVLGGMILVWPSLKQHKRPPRSL